MTRAAGRKARCAQGSQLCARFAEQGRCAQGSRRDRAGRRSAAAGPLCARFVRALYARVVRAAVRKARQGRCAQGSSGPLCAALLVHSSQHEVPQGGFPIRRHPLIQAPASSHSRQPIRAAVRKVRQGRCVQGSQASADSQPYMHAHCVPIMYMHAVHTRTYSVYTRCMYL
jgi:hypothetical protein